MSAVESLKVLSTASLGAVYVEEVISACSKQLLQRFCPDEWELLLVCRGGALFIDAAVELGFDFSFIEASDGCVSSQVSSVSSKSGIIVCDVLCDTGKTLSGVNTYLRSQNFKMQVMFVTVLATDRGFSRLCTLGEIKRYGTIGSAPSAVSNSCQSIPYDFGQVAEESGALSRMQILHEQRISNSRSAD